MSLVKVPRWRFCHSSRVTRVTRVTRQMSPDLVISVKIMHFNEFLLHSKHVSLYLCSPTVAESRKSLFSYIFVVFCGRLLVSLLPKARIVKIVFIMRILGSKDTRRRKSIYDKETRSQWVRTFSGDHSRPHPPKNPRTHFRHFDVHSTCCNSMLKTKNCVLMYQSH